MAFVLAVLGGLTVLIMSAGHQGGAALGVGLSLWLMLGAVADLGKKIRFNNVPLTRLPKNILKLPLQQWGSILAHGGLGVMILGIVGTTAWRSEVVQAVVPGAVMKISGYEVTFNGEATVSGENYSAERGEFSVRRGDVGVALLKPEKRFYTVERQSTTEAAILKNLAGHLYIVIADETISDGMASRVVRIWYHPLVAFIWIGGLIMALGGVAGLMRREVKSFSSDSV
jgi:cytochrome c-type biogenesis protein CcmF